MKIDGLFEIALKVRDLEVSSKFYQDVLGLRAGFRDERRRWLFLWVGGNAGMVVLQEDKGTWPLQHFAFSVDESELSRLKESLEVQGVKVLGPVPQDWMNALSLYFPDPDGHDLEFCAIRRGQA